MKYVILLLLCVSCTMPDAVSVSPGWSRSNYLAAGEGGWPLQNNVNDGYGLQVEVTWFLKPRQMTVTDFAWQRPPNRLAELMIGHPLHPEPTKIEITSPADDTFGDTAGKIAGVTKDMTNGELIFWVVIVLACLAALVGIGPKILEIWSGRKKAKS